MFTLRAAKCGKNRAIWDEINFNNYRSLAKFKLLVKSWYKL